MVGDARHVPGAAGIDEAARRVARRATAALGALGALMAASYAPGLHAPAVTLFPALDAVLLARTLLFFGAAWIVMTRPLGPGAFVVVLVVAALCRLPMIGSQPSSTDVYRYVWDGRVQAAGINPYRYVPADPALARLRDAAIYPYINRRDYARTIYPPVAQLIFYAVTRVSATVAGMKTAMVGFEALAVWAGAQMLRGGGRPAAQVLLYAWQPLVIDQYAGNGHVDAAAIAFIGLALLAHLRRSEALAGAALGCATLVKWYPAFLFPALWRPRDWKMPAAMAAAALAAFLPYLGAGRFALGFAAGYAREEGIVSGDRFFLLALLRLAGIRVPPGVFLAAALLAFAALAVQILRNPRRSALSDLRHAATISAGFLICFSTHYLWYFGWAAFLLCVAPGLPLLYLTGASMLLFSLLWYRRAFGIGGDIFWFNVALYAPFAMLLLAARVRAILGSASPAPSGEWPCGALRNTMETAEWAGRKT